MALNDEEFASSLAQFNLTELATMREILDIELTSRAVAEGLSPDEAVSHYFHSLFDERGFALSPRIDSGLLLVSTSVIYAKKRDNHECCQVTIKDNRESPERWVWEDDAVLARENVTVNSVSQSVLALAAIPGTIIGIHHMKKRKKSDALFAKHERDVPPRYFEVKRVESHPHSEVEYQLIELFDILPSRLPIPAQA